MDDGTMTCGGEVLVSHRRDPEPGRGKSFGLIVDVRSKSSYDDISADASRWAADRTSRGMPGVAEMAETSTTARLRVSATTLEAPETCLTSVVNSAKKERCRVCLGERSAELAKAPHKGLWSVHIVNCLPSSIWRKCLTARNTASNSLSNVLYFCSAGDIFFEKRPAAWIHRRLERELRPRQSRKRRSSARTVAKDPDGVAGQPRTKLTCWQQRHKVAALTRPTRTSASRRRPSRCATGRGSQPRPAQNDDRS